VGNVQNMKEMFFDAKRFNQRIGKWNVENVSLMDHLFCDATSFKQNVDDRAVKTFECDGLCKFHVGSSNTGLISYIKRG
jgi:hypothetical protein